MTLYIGIDAHYSSSTLVTLDEGGTELIRAKINTNKNEVLSYLRNPPHKGQRLSAVVEETNMAHWYYKILKTVVNEVTICNPLFISRRTGPKNDYRDALHLAHELRGKHLTPVYHDDSVFMEMRSLITAYQNLSADIRQAKNRYKAIFRSEALPTEGTKFYRDEEAIENLKRAHHASIATTIREQITFLEEQKENYIKKLQEITKKQPIIKKLCTIPGIDTIRATCIVARVAEPRRFANKHKFWSYAMLVSHRKESDGTSYGKRKMWGRSDLKCVFDGAAESALRGNHSLRKYYDQLRDKGITHRNAKKAVARRIAAMTLVIMKQNKKYDDHYEEKKKRELKKIR